MRRGLAHTQRAFRDLIRRRGYPCDYYIADDTARKSAFSEATGRVRGHSATGTIHGLNFTSVRTLCVRQVADSMEEGKFGPSGIDVIAEAAIYLPAKLIDYNAPYGAEGAVIRPKITDEFLVLPGTDREARYCAAKRSGESIEVYEDATGNPVCWIVWVERITRANIPEAEQTWSAGGPV